MNANEIAATIESMTFTDAIDWIQRELYVKKEPMPDKRIYRCNVFYFPGLNAITFYNHEGKAANVTFNWEQSPIN